MMDGWTDCHSHILPGIDDGSRDIEMSLGMLRESGRQGVGLMAATPHFYAQEQSIHHFLERRERAWESLRPHMEAGMPCVRLGAEVHYFSGMGVNEDLPLLKLEGTELLLLEMPFRHWSEWEVNELFELASRPDMTILMAHIERYFKTTPDELWERLRTMGVLFQCNAGFFLNWRTKRKALLRMARGGIDLLGSDCHDLTARPPDLGAAMDLLRNKMDPQTVERLHWRETVLVRGTTE